MAAPDFVPVRPGSVPAYSSPPRRIGSWSAARPGEAIGRDPSGRGLGNQGPDQGYALKLANGLRDTLRCTTGEHVDDAVAGCMAVALRRASLFGRAPMMGDLQLAFSLFGFLGEAPVDLVAFRKPLFAEAANPHHYAAVRAIAELVPESTLRLGPTAVDVAQWRSLLGQV